MAKILSVDDSKTIRDLVSAILTAQGHEVVTAEDGMQAMDIARAQKFDLILSDINMPVMSGISLVSKLRRLEGYEFIPIVMLTTEGADYKKNKAKQSGATGWLQKPFTPERLLGAVNKLIS
ncbi:MAG: response regulator [Gammaproteobacteria bacterium]|nr:response regulator [Gammaproteobacteria bacterium]